MLYSYKSRNTDAGAGAGEAHGDAEREVEREGRHAQDPPTLVQRTTYLSNSIPMYVVVYVSMSVCMHASKQGSVCMQGITYRHARNHLSCKESPITYRHVCVCVCVSGEHEGHEARHLLGNPHPTPFRQARSAAGQVLQALQAAKARRGRRWWR